MYRVFELGIWSFLRPRLFILLRNSRNHLKAPRFSSAPPAPTLMSESLLSANYTPGAEPQPAGTIITFIVRPSGFETFPTQPSLHLKPRRGFGTKPKVAPSAGLPWENRPINSQPQRGCGQGFSRSGQHQTKPQNHPKQKDPPTPAITSVQMLRYRLDSKSKELSAAINWNLGVKNQCASAKQQNKTQHKRINPRHPAQIRKEIQNLRSNNRNECDEHQTPMLHEFRPLRTGALFIGFHSALILAPHHWFRSGVIKIAHSEKLNSTSAPRSVAGESNNNTIVAQVCINH